MTIETLEKAVRLMRDIEDCKKQLERLHTFNMFDARLVWTSLAEHEYASLPQEVAKEVFDLVYRALKLRIEGEEKELEEL